MKLVLTIVDDGVVRPLADIEREVLEMAIAACGNNRSAAAKALGIGRSTLHRKLPPQRRAESAKRKNVPRKPPSFPGRLDGATNLKGVVSRGRPWIKGKGRT